MTPTQKLKHAILIKAAQFGNIKLPDEPITSENVDALYESNNEGWELQDAKSEIRCGEVGTEIPAEWSRHYESMSVAAQMPDGSWVGWTYWYGGGKHSEPDAIEWMEDAYNLSMTEERKVVTVRTFTKDQA